MSTAPLPRTEVVGSLITALPFEKQTDMIVGWAVRRASKVACVANVHMLMEAHWNPAFRTILNHADLVTPDGMPLVWMMRLMGRFNQDRVAGMELFLSLCEQASERGIGVCLVGSTPDVLKAMCDRLQNDFPTLNVVSTEPLPFRELTEEEDRQLVEHINGSEAGIVFVALGCPKQEYWMTAHRDSIKAAMVGIGGVFPVYAGLQKWAPRWCRYAGLEWLYRLIQEPKRLWKRYASTIPLFILLSLYQLFAKNDLSRRILWRRGM